MAQKRSTATRRAESAAAQKAAAIRKEHEREERRRRSLIVGTVVVVVLAVALVIGYIGYSGRDTSEQFGAAPANATDTYAMAVGPSSAPATITVYEDFMCPNCEDLEAVDRDWMSRDTADGKVQVRYVPISILDRSSNGTKYSTRAASALGVVLSSSGTTVAKKFHDLLYENQPQENSDGLSDAKLIDLAVQAGAKRSAVSSAIDDTKYEKWVANSTDQVSKNSAFSGTPFVLYDGKPFEAGNSWTELSDALRAKVDAAQD